ncbi:hypothetical protein [Spirillospora sp. NPDC047279]|uniref:hypothetical protein n=1 Tax=Spirillospora sp. NPDC047279 TaxID=3155478 RepID=UPI0033CCC58E
MRMDLGRITAKIDYLLSRDDVVHPPNVIADWDAEGLREPLSDERLTPDERLLGSIAGRHMGQLDFYAAKDRYERLVDDSETEWEGEHDWICVGESELATTTAVLLHARTGETVLYDSDAWDWGPWDNFILVKESFAAFVDDVVLGLDYRRLYYQNWVELTAVLDSEDLEFPGIYGDPWYLLLREMHADLFGGQPVSRSRRKELVRRIEKYFEDPDES